MVSMLSLRFVFLCLATGLYALFGSPTPNYPGITEAAIGLFLFLSVGLLTLPWVLALKKEEALWLWAGKVLFLYGALIALLIGVAQGNGMGLISRDLAPFLFMMLPLLVYELFDQRPEHSSFFVILLCFLGFFEALRALLQVYVSDFPLGVILEGLNEPHYLSNSPAVLFSSIVLFAGGVFLFIKAKNMLWSISALGVTALSIVPVLAMVLALQRASLGVWGVLLLSMIVWAFLKDVKRAIVLLAIITLICVYTSVPELLIELLSALSEKSDLVGSNMRIQEAEAVWNNVSSHGFLNVIFGLGWGAGFESPAVGEMYVHYTHGLFTSMFLKTGLFGLLLSILYIGGLLYAGYTGAWKDAQLIYVAAFIPIVIDVFLYAAHKSLDFGLILLLISCLKTSEGILPLRRWCCIDNV